MSAFSAGIPRRMISVISKMTSFSSPMIKSKERTPKSQSMINVRKPSRARRIPRLAETVDFPTPPLPLTTPIIFFTLLFLLAGTQNCSLLGFFESQPEEQELQFPEHPLICSHPPCVSFKISDKNQPIKVSITLFREIYKIFVSFFREIYYNENKIVKNFTI